MKVQSPIDIRIIGHLQRAYEAVSLRKDGSLPIGVHHRHPKRQRTCVGIRLLITRSPGLLNVLRLDTNLLPTEESLNRVFTTKQMMLEPTNLDFATASAPILKDADYISNSNFPRVFTKASLQTRAAL